MISMREKMARAMSDRLIADNGAWTLAQRDGTNPNILTLDGTFDTGDFVDACLDALMEPTEAMIESSGVLPRDAITVYGAMIRAAKEGK